MSDIIFTDDIEEPDPVEELDAIEASIEEAEEGIDPSPPPLYPLGRGVAYDFRRGGFIPHGAGPLQTTGLDTLRYWVEKCLRTARGAHAVYSDNFGIEGPTDEVGEPLATVMSGDIAERVRDALKVHPRIANVSSVRVQADLDDDYLLVSFTVEVSGPEGVELEFDSIPLEA